MPGDTLSRLAMSLAMLLALGGATPSAHAQSAVAQPAPPPGCDAASVNRKIETVLRSPTTPPDLKGCRYIDVLRPLRAHDFTITANPDSAAPYRARGIISDVGRDGYSITLSISTGAGYTPPSRPTPATTPTPATPAEVSITGSPSVVEGGAITFQLVRAGGDDKPYTLALSYSDPSLLRDPPASVQLTAVQQPLTLHTQPGVPGDGDHRIAVTLTDVDGGAIVGKGRTATGLIRDAPALPPTATSVTISADGIMRRGEPLRFTVTRTGPLPAADIGFDIAQGGTVSVPADGKPASRKFGEGVPSLPLVIPPRDYDPCGEPPIVTLRTGPGNPASATAAFSDYMPYQCSSGALPRQSFWDSVRQSIAASPLGWGLGLLLVVTAVIASVLLLKRRPDPSLPVRSARPDRSRTQDPAAPVTAACTIETGVIALFGRDRQFDRWPEIAVQVTIEPGSSLAPQPLPIREPNDG